MPGSDDLSCSALKKRELIQKAEALQSGTLIYRAPDAALLYTVEEIRYLLQPLVGLQIPPQLGHVQKSHYVKKKVLELLGYAAPSGFRTVEARTHQPRFIHQLMDIFVQASTNLQVWNCVPSAELPLPYEWNSGDPAVTYATCRYVIVKHTVGGMVTKILVKEGRDLALWDRTGTRTMKWQASIGTSVRTKYAGGLVVGADRLAAKLRCPKPLTGDQKQVSIRELDIEPGRPLIKRKPDPCLVHTLEELGQIVRPLLGWRMRDPGSYGTGVVGQRFEKEVAARMGYIHVEQTDTGDFPDLVHQVLEVKFQYSPTIDLGRVLPVDRVSIKEPWNDFGLQPRDVRYLSALGVLEAGYYSVRGLLLISGDEFPDHFGLVKGQSFKVQLRIPAEELVS